MIIPQSQLDRGWNYKVHVQGWNPAQCFFYVGTKNGLHELKTQRGKTYHTANSLLYTKRHRPNR